jgi:c-di-GMP-binding flagellar brake protein YcgR
MAAKETTTSKRGALRLSGYDRPLSYRTDYDDGEARLVNISTSGCAIYKTSTELADNDKILISFALEDPKAPVQIQATVIRAEGEGYGLQFLHVEDDLKGRLIRFFAQENRRQKRDTINII